MTETERYLAGVTVVGALLYLLLLLRRWRGPGLAEPTDVASRSLLLTDLAVLVLAIAAIARNAFAAERSAAALAVAWTVMAGCAIARLTITRKPRDDAER